MNKKIISRNKNIMSGAYVIAGSRIMVMSIKRFAQDGYSVEQIKEEYPQLTNQQIVSALNFMNKQKPPL